MPIVNIRNIVRATAATMIIAAAFHLATNLFFAITTNSPDLANMFNVIGVSLLVPELGQGSMNSLLGILFVVGFGIGVYFVMQYHDMLRSKK